jgi:transposase-like protein
MIRLFSLFGKLEISNVSSLGLFHEAMNSFNPHRAICPFCKAKDTLSYHAQYRRDLIVYESDQIYCHSICVQRFICSSCDRTHAVLPPVLVPYGSYSLLFILHVLREYFTGRFSCVRDLCKRFSISVSTLYAWKSLFLKHKALWLGVLQNLCVAASRFLDEILVADLDLFLCSFFDMFAFSFLQNKASPSPYLSG